MSAARLETAGLASAKKKRYTVNPCRQYPVVAAVLEGVVIGGLVAIMAYIINTIPCLKAVTAPA
jgi:hypothetical protein